MKMIKSLILGSAASLVAVGGAQAADLPVKAKAVEYVKICSLYGAGFYYVPGTDTCLKLGGYLRSSVTFNGAGAHGGPAWSGDAGQEDRYQNKFIDRTRMQLNVDTRTATEYGILRTFGIVDIQVSTLGGGSFAPASIQNNLAAVPVLDNAGAGTVVPEQLFMQFAGFTFGKSFSAFSSPWGELIAFNNSSYIFGSHDTSVGVNNIQYTTQFGNGMSATVGMDDPSAFNRTAVYNLNAALGATGTSSLGNAYAAVRMPDIVGNLKLDQAWGLFQLSGAVHEVDASYNVISATGATNASDLSGHPSTKYGGSVMAALQFKNVPTGPGDDLKFDATWSKGDTKNVISTSGGPSPNFAMWGSGAAGQAGSVAFGATTDGVYLPVANGGDGSLHLTTAYAVRGGFTHNWDPHWSSSVFATQSWVKYDTTATANYCAAYAVTVANPGTYTCNPNYSLTQLGANVRWTPVAGLTFSAEAMYIHFGTGFSGFGTLAAPTAPLPAGVYQFKNQNTAELEVRVQRNF